MSGETMTTLHITYKKVYIWLLFQNEFMARMWAEQWAWRYFDRPGSWDDIGFYELTSEWPYDYVSGLCITVSTIDLHDYKCHNFDSAKYIPDFTPTESPQRLEQAKEKPKRMLSKDELFYPKEE